MTAYDKRPATNYCRTPQALCPACKGRGLVACVATDPARIAWAAPDVNLRSCDCCKPIVETRNAETR